MRRALVLLLTVFAFAALAATTAAAHERTRFSSCSRGFDGTRNDPAVAVFYIEVRDISCKTTYRYIENFPGALQPRMIYRSYTCTYRFEASSDLFEFVCTDGHRAYKFAAAGE